MTVRIMVGHVMDKLRELPDESVHCCVTSPPYYGLRSYGTEPQIWGEPKPICDHVHKWGEERARSVGNAPSATKSAAMAERRLRDDAGLFADVAAELKRG